MDGTPQVVRFDVTTLWHLDAAEWAPSTASKPVSHEVSKCFPVCPRKQNSDRRVKLLSNGGPPMMRGEQHETHDRCNHSPDDVSSRSNSGASTNRSRCAIDHSGGDPTDQR